MALLHLRVCTVDLEAGWVERDGTRDRLSATERRLLRWFVDHGGRVVSRQELLREVWHWRARRDTRAVDTAVRRLRARVEQNPQEPDHLFTVHGIGFRFVPLRQESSAILGPNVPALPLVHEALNRRSVAEVEAPPGSGGTALAWALLAGPGLRVRVDLRGCPVALVALRAGEALEPGAATDPERLASMLRAAGDVTLVFDHAEPAQIVALYPFLPPSTRAVWIGRDLRGIDRIVLPLVPLPARSRERLPPATERLLRRLARAGGGLPDALAASAFGADADTLRLSTSRRLVQRRDGRWFLTAPLADPIPDPGWVGWLRQEVDAALREWHRYEVPSQRPLLVWLADQLHAELEPGGSSEDWRRVGEIAYSLGARSWSRVAFDAAVAAAERDSPVALATALFVRATHLGDPDDVPRAAALGVPAEKLGAWPMFEERAGYLRAFDSVRLEGLAATLPALAEANGRWDIARAAFVDAARAAQWLGHPRRAGRHLAELAAFCERTGFSNYTARFGASALLARAETPDDDHPHEEIDSLLRAIRAPEAGPPEPGELVLLASVLWRAERDAEAVALLAEARESAHRKGWHTTEIAALNNLGVADWLDGRWGRAAQRFQAALVLADRLDSAGYRAMLHMNLGATLLDPESLDEAERLAANRPQILALIERRRLILPAPLETADARLAAARASAVSEVERTEVHVYAGILALHRGDRAAAEAIFTTPVPAFVPVRVARAFLARALRRA